MEKALLKCACGQEYTIGSHRLRRADLPEIRNTLDWLNDQPTVEDEQAGRGAFMCQTVMERIKYTSPNAICGELTLEQLKAYFGVANIIVSGGVYNNAARNQPKNVETFWPQDRVLLACVSSGDQDLKEPALGRTFVCKEDAPKLLVTEQYREEQTLSNVYRVRMHTDECIQFAGAGYILTGATPAKLITTALTNRKERPWPTS